MRRDHLHVKDVVVGLWDCLATCKRRCCWLVGLFGYIINDVTSKCTAQCNGQCMALYVYTRPSLSVRRRCSTRLVHRLHARVHIIYTLRSHVTYV